MYALAKSTSEIYSRIVPDEALPENDPRYVPLEQARGTHDFARAIAKRVLAYPPQCAERTPHGYARLLITGHSGCGKTTEINRARQILSESRYSVVYFDAAAELDMQKQDLSWWSLLLEMVWQTEDQLRREPWGIGIPDDQLRPLMEWLSRIVTKKTERVEMETSLATEFGAGSELPFLAKAKATLKALIRAGSSTVKDIELEMERRPAEFLDSVSDIVHDLNLRLQKKNSLGLVVIADGLEKIPLRRQEVGITTHSQLFIHSGKFLVSPPCHLLYTLPLALLRSENITNVFPAPPLIMPMVHVQYRDGTPDRSALRTMADIVYRRVEKKLFAPGVIRQLALASGGHIRDFLLLVREAAGNFSGKITATDARHACSRLSDLRERLCDQQYIPLLDYVIQNQTLRGSPDDGELINRLLVLQYQNDRDWTDVHPLIKNSSRFLRSPRDDQNSALKADTP